MATEKYHLFRGDVKAVAAAGDTVAFVTVHPEGQPTALYRLDADKLALAQAALPAGGVAVVADGDNFWVAGSDGRVYLCPAKGAPAARGPAFAEPIAGLALASNDRLAVLAGTEVTLLSRKDGKAQQTLELPEPGTCLAVDPTGQWLAVGTVKGTVLVFEAESQADFTLSDSGKLHDGAVTALLFEAEELRFLSAGADLKLLSTFARGRLEPEDRGRGNNHTELVTALVRGPERFYSGSRDSTVKAWPRGQGRAPATQKDGVAQVVGLALVQVHKRTFLAAGCADNTIRLFSLDETGKIAELASKVYGATAAIRFELSMPEATRREAALKTLADFNDNASVEVIADQMGQDPDHGLRLRAAQLLADSKLPRAAKLLEKGLNHQDEAVRVAAFKGLRKHAGKEDLRVLDLALRTNKADVGKHAVEALEELAARDDQALARLMEALNARTPEVRQAALAALEKVHEKDSPEGDLIALTSQHADLRRLALIRLYQRKLLGHPDAQAALRWRGEDPEAEVRRTAYLLTLYTRPNLAPLLRKLDPELNRQLVELENDGKESPEKVAAKAEKPEKKPAATKPEEALPLPTRSADAARELAEADYEPLLQATASRSLDTCLRGARGLAVLGDPRAFGLLLQLSREDDRAARVEVCRAMAALDDPRAVNRLRSLLYDPEASVRDAAFTALAHIHQSDPLLAAESGLNASFEDVRRRGLQALIAEVRKAKKPDDRALQLMLRALNDGAPAVRSEAFKSALNLQVGGGGADTLRFTLNSVHPDIRREALTEVMAQVGEPWAWALLLEFLNDPEPRIRSEAFAFATKKSKELETLEAGLKSRYADVRKMAVDGLIKKHTKAAQALLVKALDDPEKEVRLTALSALVDDDARPPLVQALATPHNDVRVRAAQALARHGAPEALAPLLELATAPRPEQKERRAEWAALVAEALGGLEELGDTSALPAVVPLLDSRRPTIRAAAGKALVGLARPGSLDPLRAALQHADPQVKYRAALGLAYAGDPAAAPIVFTEEAQSVLTADEQLAAALALGPAGEDQLVVFLDHPDENVRDRALLVMMLLELADSRGAPTRCLACLSSKMPRVRLTAARALENFSDPAAFEKFVVGLFNDRGDEPAWKVPAETVKAVAQLLAFGDLQTKVRTVRILANLVPKEQHAWDLAWSVHSGRFKPEIAAIAEQGKSRKAPAMQYDDAQLRQLAFGAYVGLVREQGGAGTAGRPSAGSSVVRVRQTALSRILALANADPAYARAARPVFVQALGDPNQPVRTQAFEHLQALGLDSATLGAEALAAGHTDLGIRGLEVLTDGTSASEGEKVLEQVMLNRKDDLAIEAAKLLAARRPKVAVAKEGLAAAYEPMRQTAVGWLAAEYDQNASAQEALRQALESRYQKVRESAALELGVKKDPRAFDALVKILQTTPDGQTQRRAIDALVAVGDKRAPSAFLDRLENDPAGTALTDALLDSIASFRQPESVERLLAYGEKSNKWDAVYGAVGTVSGFDQPNEDPEDERPNDTRWEKEQHPRHSAVLARLLEHALQRGTTRILSQWMDEARWSRGNEVDPVLALLVNHSDEDLRHAAVEALAWRLRKRKGSPEPLLKALRHRDPTTQFLGAEGLALGGRAEGISVLLSAVEYLDDYEYRRRAVLALGELADRRALDLLLKLANESGHALQEPAAEAIGHLSKSEQAEEIFRLLERFAKGSDGVAETALRGLRWFNTRAGWQLIRQRAQERAFRYRPTAIELLGYDDDPATRDLLLRILATPPQHHYDFDATALESARRLFGADSLEPDYALLRSGRGKRFYQAEEPIKRVSERGDVVKILEILPSCDPDVQDELATSILNRPTLPVAEAKVALNHPDARSVQLAAHVLGRAGEEAPGAADAAKAVSAALAKWRTAWDEQRRKMIRANVRQDPALDKITRCLEALLWAAGRLRVGTEVLRSAAEARPDDPLYKPVRLAAVSAIVTGPLTDKAIPALEAAVQGNDPEARAMAAEALARGAPQRAGALAEKVLSDRVSFTRIAEVPGVPVEGTLRSAAGQLHYQGVALPLLVRRKDIDGLMAVLENRKLPEATRLGAVEGLAAMADERSEAKLVQVGKDESEPEEIRKAAWRGLRRSKRARAKAATKGTLAGA